MFKSLTVMSGVSDGRRGEGLRNVHLGGGPQPDLPGAEALQRRYCGQVGRFQCGELLKNRFPFQNY